MSKKFKEFWTSKADESLEKPGSESIHSAKWDDCVQEVSKDPNVNAYAICTRQLGEESFKSIENMSQEELAKAMDEVQKAMDIEDAGEIPYSLLARQDMENRKRRFVNEKDTDKNRRGDGGKQERAKPIDMGRPKPISIDEAKRIAFELMGKFYNYVDIVQYLVEDCGVEQGIASEIVRIIFTQDDELTKNIFKPRPLSIHDKEAALKKASVEIENKKLGEAVKDAKDVSDTTEKNELVDNIRSIQRKRQAAEINARKNGGNFNSNWRKMNYENE